MLSKTREWFGRLEASTGGYYTNIEYDGEEAAVNYGTGLRAPGRRQGEV